MSQPTLWGDEPDDRKEAGQQKAREACATWHDLAMDWFATQLRSRRVTADDLVAAVGLPRVEVGKDRNNAVGAAFTAAARAHLIMPTGVYVKSQRRRNNSAVIQVWRGAGAPRPTVVWGPA